MYRISSNSRCPWNVTTYFSQLIPINTALEHGRGLTVIYVQMYAHAHYTCIQIGSLLKLCTRMHVNLSRRPSKSSHPQIIPHQTGSRSLCGEISTKYSILLTDIGSFAYTCICLSNFYNVMVNIAECSWMGVPSRTLQTWLPNGCCQRIWRQIWSTNWPSRQGTCIILRDTYMYN